MALHDDKEIYSSKNITVLNAYVPNNRAPKYMRQKPDRKTGKNTMPYK